MLAFGSLIIFPPPSLLWRTLWMAHHNPWCVSHINPLGLVVDLVENFSKSATCLQHYEEHTRGTLSLSMNCSFNCFRVLCESFLFLFNKAMDIPGDTFAAFSCENRTITSSSINCHFLDSSYLWILSLNWLRPPICRNVSNVANLPNFYLLALCCFKIALRQQKPFLRIHFRID